jgi:hypothetical protein
MNYQSIVLVDQRLKRNVLKHILVNFFTINVAWLEFGFVRSHSPEFQMAGISGCNLVAYVISNQSKVVLVLPD